MFIGFNVSYGNFVASKEECFLCFNVYAENVDVEIYLCVVYNFCQAEQCVYGNFVAEVGECFSRVEVRCCVLCLCLCFVHCGGGGRVF